MTIGGLKSIVYLGLMKQQETMESRMLLCALLAEGLGWNLDFQEKDNAFQAMFGTLNPFRKKLLKLSREACCANISSMIGPVEPDRLVAMLDSPMLSHVDGEHVEFNRSKYGHLSAPASREYGVTQECDLKKTSIRRKEVRPVEATDVCSENLSAFAEKWGDDLKNFGKRYIWQWKIPSSVYEILKKNLTWIVSGIFGTQGNIKATIKRLGNDQAIRLFSRLVAVYCAEWFKREFNGYDLENNALEDIGLIGPGIAQEIFCRAYGEENVCHAGNHREWLWSMYVQGGLPVNYIVQKNRNNNMVDTLAAYFAPGEQTSNELSGEDDVFRNQVMAQSESIQSYIDCLRTLHQDGNVGWPIAEEDLSREPFVSFRNFVLEGKRKANQRRRQSKFYLEWLAWKSNDNDQFAMALLLCLHSNPQTTRPNKDIPIETARMWGIPDDENLFEFEIVIKQGRIPLLTIPFYKAVGRDYFYNTGGYFKFILASDYGRYPAESHYGVLNGERRISWLLPLTIGWRTSEREGGTLQTLDLPPCIPFTLEKQNRWSSRKQVGEKALFVLDRMKFKVETGSPEVAVCGESLWIPVYSRIECSYGGKKLAILPYVAGTLYVEPQEQLFSNAVRYRNGKVEYRDKDDVAHPAFLIKPSTTFKGYIEDGTEAIRIRKNLKWNYAGQLGFCDVVVSDEATGKKAIVSCFVIPDEATLERNLQHYQIRSSYLNAEKILPVNSNEQVDTVPYTIRSGNDSLTLEVYRPISDDGSIFIRNTDVLIPANINYLPLKFLAFYQLRRVDEHGCVRLDFVQEESDSRPVRNAIYRDLYYPNNQNVVSILNVNFMPYSSNVIENNRQGYFIKLNGDCLKSCRFLFYEFASGKIVDVQCIEQDGKTELHFDSPNEGMLFQTLAELDALPLYYFRPRYVPSAFQANEAALDSKKRRFRRCKRICRYAHQPDWDGAIRDFRLAIVHSLYFNVFDRLCALTWTSKDDFEDSCYQCNILCNVRKNELDSISFRFAQFFVSLCAQTEQVDYQALYRLSSEMLFDWWAVSRSTWLEVIRLSTRDEEQRARFRSAVQELLESKPDVGTMEPDKKRIVDEFWRLPMRFRRSKLSANRVAQCLRGDAKDANMDMGHEQRSKRMSDFDGIKYADLYMLLCNTRQ